MDFIPWVDRIHCVVVRDTCSGQTDTQVMYHSDIMYLGNLSVI
jgi:hypothetical protein